MEQARCSLCVCVRVRVATPAHDAKVKVRRKEVVRHHVPVVPLKEVQFTVSRLAVWLCVPFGVVYSDSR